MMMMMITFIATVSIIEQCFSKRLRPAHSVRIARESVQHAADNRLDRDTKMRSSLPSIFQV
jgi:hypothetical protein